MNNDKQDIFKALKIGEKFHICQNSENLEKEGSLTVNESFG
jgi:hypothetical protein